MEVDPERVEMFRNMWDRLRVPVRPGREGLELYRTKLQHFARKNVLILGATPELVDMALELGADQVVSVERHPEVIAAMRQLGTRDWDRARLVVGDWLEERAEWIGAFHCVVCDGGLLFLEYPGQWQRLFQLVHSYLAPGGVFVAKEWAEPPGELLYPEVVAELIERFAADSADLGPAERAEAFAFLVSELRLAAFIGTTRQDASFDQALLVERLDALLDRVTRQFPEPELVSLAEGALKHLARSRSGTTDTVAGARFDMAERLLSREGFGAEHFPLPDRPVAGGNYMFVARK